LSTTNPTLFDLGSNLGLLGGKPETNPLRYGMASVEVEAEVEVSPYKKACYYQFTPASDLDGFFG
jgi:hypothetical protein